MFTLLFNTFRPTQDDRLFQTFSNAFSFFLLRFHKFFLKVWIHNIPELVQIMAWWRSGNKPLSEPTMISLLMHICVNWPRWVNGMCNGINRGIYPERPTPRAVLNAKWSLTVVKINMICEDSDSKIRWFVYFGSLQRRKPIHQQSYLFDAKLYVWICKYYIMSLMPLPYGTFDMTDSWAWNSVYYEYQL